MEEGSQRARTSSTVVLVTPVAEEAQRLCRWIDAAGHPWRRYGELTEALAERHLDACALIVVSEALGPGREAQLVLWLEARMPWSELPVLLLDDAPAAGHALVDGGHATVVPRAVAEPTLASWLLSARRAQQRQEEIGSLLRELERDVRVGRLIARLLGHDLRTPLAAIMLSAEVILRGSQDQRALRPAGRILSSAHRMQRLVEQLFDYTRLREGRGLSLHVREADAGEICRAVIREVESGESESRLLFDERGDPLGEWDPDRLGQLLSTLFTNAVRHGRPGQPAQVMLDGGAQERVAICVRNPGVIAPETVAALFEPFRQLQKPAEPVDGLPHLRAGEGLGLGLFLAREIARAHGGELEVVSSASGEGTTFRVSLPRRTAAA